MNIDIQDLAKRMTGGLGEELLAEINRASWEQPKNQYLEELGISYGHHQGMVRKRNDDRLIIAEIASANGQFYILSAICDGVGGSESGDTAAEIAITSIISEIAYAKIKLPASEILSNALRRADERVRECLNGRGLTTASIILTCSDGELISANIGDSRVFTWSDGSKSLKQVSTDDTLENELRKLNIKDASALRQKGLLGSLSQAIGEADRDSSELKIRIQYDEDFESKVMLASDGVWKNSEDAFYQIALNSKKTAETPKRLLVVANWAGGADNSSVIVIDNKDHLIEYCKNRVASKISGISINYWFAETKYHYKETLLPIYLPAENSQNKAYKKVTRRPKPKLKSENHQSELAGLNAEEISDEKNNKKVSDRRAVKITIDENNQE